MKKNIFLLYLMIVVILLGCDNATNPPKITNDTDTTLDKNYLIYYPLSQSDGWRPEHSGLFMYSLYDSDAPDRILSESVVHTSSVGADGSIVFQYEFLPQKFWVRYSDGTTIPVIFPQTDQKDMDYKYSIPPHIELSGDGKFAVYFTSLERLDGTKQEENNQKMIIANLSESTFNIHELRLYYEQALNELGVNFAVPYGKYFLVNYDGTKVWFVMKCMKFISGNFIDIGYMVFKFSNGSFSKISDLSVQPIELAGIDIKSEKIFAYVDNDLKILQNHTYFESTMFKKDNMSNPHQFATTKSEMVIWTDYGIELYNPLTENKIAIALSWDSIKTIYTEIIKMPSNFLSISPDGGLVTFSIDKGTDPKSYDLFAIRRNGKDLKRIVPNTPIGIPVISYGIKK